MLKLHNKIRITKVLHQSSSKAFKGAKVGDVLLLEIPVKDVTFGSCAGVYASYIEVTNLRTGYKGSTSMTLFTQCLNYNYEYEEYGNETG